ncbi:MAG TPA: hypothetical protein VKZ53_28455 [Candidatus Angelobacter sp.]|nr:hypothetical protein [Candidatus Angelobacter sp.]
MKSQNRTKRIVFSIGSKGGTGKSTFVLALADWLLSQNTQCVLLDLDIENKVKGSLKHFYPQAPKIDVHTPSGLDAFIDYLDGDCSVLLADMGASQGQVAFGWFDAMYESVAGLGISFTAIGLVTDDPASVDGLLSWAAALQHRVEYLVVENSISAFCNFVYWRESEQASRFREIFNPSVIPMRFRVPELEAGCRNHGVTLGQVASRQTSVSELQKTSLVLRAQSYRNELFNSIEEVRQVILP